MASEECDHSALSTSGCSRVAVVTCAVIESELRELARGSDQILGISVVEQRLHDTPDLLRERLCDAVKQIETETRPDVVVLGYGLCSRGVERVTTASAKLVVPRAHDCVTLLLGSRERYANYARRHPGTYWFSPGWIRHGAMPSQQRYDRMRDELARQYGTDNADFLMESERAWLTAYSRAAFVDVGGIDFDPELLEFTREAADWLGWTFDRQYGDSSLLRDLISGPWDDERFLVLQPGESVECSADDRIMRVVSLRVAGKVIE